MGPPPERRRKRKKRGRPSLIELQKRSLRLENQRLRNLMAGTPGREERDEDEAEEGSHNEKRLKFMQRLPGSGGAGDGRPMQWLDGTSDREKVWDTITGGASQDPTAPDFGPGATPLPDKKLLVFILDRLQKKDTYGVYAEPADPEELPDYHDIIKHPMDFATIRKNLETGAYTNLEQFEDDVFLICSNAMCYNSPDTIYYRQARAIQELAKKDFGELRLETDSDESEELKPQKWRPPMKNLITQKMEWPNVDRATTDFSPGSTLTTSAGSNGRLSPGSDDHKSSRKDDCSGGKGVVAKHAKKVIIVDENRRNTHRQPQPSCGMYNLPVVSALDGLRKLLVPAGLQAQHSYSRSLALFAADLGSVGWEIAAKRIEQSLPQGMKFGRGWVGNSEAPQLSHSPLFRTSPSRHPIHTAP